MLIRWLLFLSIGIVGQVLTYLIYPIMYVFWLLLVFKPTFLKEKPEHNFAVDPKAGSETIFNGALLNNKDDHGAFTMYGYIQKEGLELLQVDGNLIRKLYPDGSMNRKHVSGDVVVAWFFANELADRKASDEVLLKVVDTYISNLGTLSFDEVAQGYVSARCSNFGINEAKDSQFLKISQPAAGPQFYTNSAVLASAYNKGFKYKVAFWTHWVLMGGWYWAAAPILYTDNKPLWYARDITMKSLYIHLQVFGPRWWIKRPMEFITDGISTHENDLFYAMMGREINPLPDSMDAFFSQRGDSTSEFEEGDMSPYVPEAIRKIQKQTRFNE